MERHIAIYTRVSTKAQDTASQDKELKAWAKTVEEPVKWYSDTTTGKTMNRPGMNRLIDDLHSGRISKVVIWRLDRLGRTAEGLITLIKDIETHKATFFSLRDNIDLETPSGRLLLVVLAGVAAFETEVRYERVRAGQAAARARGVRWGGSKKGRKMKSRMNPEQAQIINQMKDTHTITKIAETIGRSRQTVYNYLKASMSLLALYVLFRG